MENTADNKKNCNTEKQLIDSQNFKQIWNKSSKKGIHLFSQKRKQKKKKKKKKQYIQKKKKKEQRKNKSFIYKKKK